MIYDISSSILSCREAAGDICSDLLVFFVYCTWLTYHLQYCLARGAAGDIYLNFSLFLSLCLFFCLLHRVDIPSSILSCRGVAGDIYSAQLCQENYMVEVHDAQREGPAVVEISI